MFNEMERDECLRTVTKVEMEGVNVVAFIIKYNNIVIKRHATERKCLLVSIVAFFHDFSPFFFFFCNILCDAMMRVKVSSLQRKTYGEFLT